MSNSPPRVRAIDYDRIAGEYSRHRKAHPGVVLDLATEAVLTPASLVLEVGSGTGNYLAALRTLTGCRCRGLDPSAEMLARARGSGDRLVRAVAERLPFRAESLDLVFSVDVIHHVADRPRFFEDAHRVLRRGGRVATVTDSEWIIRNRQPLSVYFPETVAIELDRYPSLAILRREMRSAGFDAIEERMVERPYRLADAQPYRDRAFSSLHLIGDEAFRRGLSRMERDLERGAIDCVSRYVLLWGKDGTTRG